LNVTGGKKGKKKRKIASLPPVRHRGRVKPTQQRKKGGGGELTRGKKTEVGKK